MKRTFAFQLRCLPLLGMFVGLLVAAASGCAGDLDPMFLTTGTAGSQGQSGTSGGAGTTGTAGTGGGMTVCDAPGTIFQSTAVGGCALGGCHDTTATGGGLDLKSAGVVGRLLDKGPSTNTDAGAACMAASKPYLKSGSNPATGLLLDKLAAGTTTCGTPMPQIGSLNATQKKCLNDWATAVTTGAITQ